MAALRRRGDTNSLVKLWDVATGEELLTNEAKRGQVRFLEFPRDGKVLAVVSHSEEGSVLKMFTSE